MNQTEIRKIAVFCGSSIGNKQEYRKTAEELVNVMSDMGITLVFGGSDVGLMSVIANRMLKNGGKAIGVIPKSLVDVEIAHKSLTEMHVVNSMHERKAVIAEMSDGFMMLPGGPGSLDEFFEMLTWAQLGYHSKPCGILNIEGYYNYLLKFLDHAMAEGFFKQVYRDMIIVEQSPQILIQKFKNYQAPLSKKWINDLNV